MKKIYLIPILVMIVISILISNTYATLTISNQQIHDVPVFTMQGNNIFCIQKGQPIGSGTVEEGTISYTPQSTVRNWPSYTTVGEYDLPIEIAYALTSGASLKEMQYAIWYSSMNEGNTLQGDPNDTELADLPEYNEILGIQNETTNLENAMKIYVEKKDSVNKTIAEIKMQNTNIETIVNNIKVQSEEWEKEPDTTYIQKMYDDNENKIKELEEKDPGNVEIEKLKAISENIKSVIDSKSYNTYISFLETCIEDNNNAIKSLENSIAEYETALLTYEENIKNNNSQIESLKQSLGEEYTALYNSSSMLLHDGKLYKEFYEEVEKAGGYNPTSSKDKTKLVKLSNNTYKAGPFKLHYIEGEAGDVNFSYIENMYLEDQDGDIIEDIEIINCEEYNGEYPASDAKFYIKFKAREKEVLEDKDVDTRTWREGNYKYTETTTIKTYGIKLIVDFRYLQVCGGKYSRLEGKGDVIGWREETESDGEDTITYWVAEKNEEYPAQTLIGVSSNINEIDLKVQESKYDYDEPTRAWGDYVLEVYAVGREEDEDTDKEKIPERTPGPDETPTPGPGETPTPGPGETPTPGPDETPTPGPEPTPTPEPLKLTMEVSGYVFEDIAANKENTTNGLLDYNSNDKLLEGIEVAIYEENGDLVRLVQEYEENPEVSKENSEIRTNPTITDENGHYTFKGLDPDKKYYIEFRYNGLTYEATTYKASVGNSDGTIYTGEAWKINSKAVENINDRTKLNSIYGEISAYPNNYKKAYDIGLGIGEYNKIYLQTDLVNNNIYSWNNENVNIYTLVTRYIQNYIEKNRKYPDILEIYKNIYNDQINHDSEIANKLQFIEDSKISSYTSPNGDTKDLYPIYEEFAIEEEKVKIDETYEPIYMGQKYINFGIKEREEFDLTIAKDVYSAEVHINGKIQKYNYNNVEIDYTDESWNAYVKGSDIGYDRNIYASDYFAKDIGLDSLSVYVTYRIALRNQTSMIDSGVTKIIDYYDSEYTYVGNTENTCAGINSGLAYVGNSKGELVENATWINGEKNGNFNTGYITFENGELNLKNGEDKFIYVTFKVNKNESNLLYSDGELLVDGTVIKQAAEAKQNIVEIAGYKTYYANSKTYTNEKTIEAGSIAGVIDRDSVVGNLNPNNVEEINKEDDSDKASGFSLLIDWTNFRSLSGNVWEELPTENSLNEGTRLGNGEKESNERNIKNVTVKVLINGTDRVAKGYIKQPDGTYKWEDLIGVTDDNGNYSFSGYIPGDYKVRFTYGNVSEDGRGILTEEMKLYNGQDYKSTIYNNDATIIDGRIYWYSVDENKLKSDAKDSWARRQDVNNYSIDLDNKKSNILKKDSVDSMLKADKTWMISETDTLVFEVEYARTGTESVLNSNDNHVYKVQNVDLGLVERPRSQLLIEKDVSNIKVILGDNTVLFDAILNAEGKLEVKNANIGVISRIAKTHDIKTTPAQFGVGKNGQITMNIDEELMQGAQINITYKVLAENIGEIDYTTQEFYYNGIKGTDAQIAKTSATTIIDYVSNTLKTTQMSSDWSIIDNNTVKTMVEFETDDASLTNEEYTSLTVDKHANIIKTNALNQELKPGEKTNLDLLLSTTMSPENNEDDLRYDNILELVESKNEVGRRHELSVLGNQDPSKDVTELDSGKAETVLIIPPFGMNDDLATKISIAIVLIAAFGIGVYYIKRRVLK